MVGPGSKTTACVLCECNCGINIELEGRRFAKIRGDKTHPASEGYTCEKALRLDLYQNGPHRITSPLKRTDNGDYVEIDWDTALDEIATKLSRIKSAYGGRSIFFYGGGGQGNHLGSANALALRGALESKYHSNALAQEKTGEIWVDGRLYGGHTKGDFDNAEVLVFIGKNPWQSHSFPRARPLLKQVAADPARSMIVVDPRVSETAAMADFHLQVAPGGDAWLIAAMVAVIVQEDLVDDAFVDTHTSGYGPVRDAFAAVDIAAFALTCGVAEDQIRAAARRIATAESVCVYEDLGIQQAPNSTLVSYLNKLLWILTGNFGKPGTMFLHSSFASLTGGGSGTNSVRRTPTRVDRAKKKAIGTGVTAAGRALAFTIPRLSRIGRLTAAVESVSSKALDVMVPFAAGLLASGVGAGGGERVSPVTGAKIIGGLVPCNSIADEVLTDHPDRFRAMWIDSSNPAHSIADSKRFRQAMRALELSVVIDVAFTETARQADYVLPAASQFEKPEATFFNFEFPKNVFHLRKPILDPLPGTLPEPEIYARLLRRLDVVDAAVLERLRSAAQGGRDTFATTFFASVAAEPRLGAIAPFLLYETLGQTLPPKLRGAAVLWGVSQMCALSNPEAVARSGYSGSGLTPGNKLFDSIIATDTGVVFTTDTWDDVWDYVKRPDRRFTIDIDSLLTRVRELGAAQSVWTTEEFPFVLAAGERRSFTANTIFRNPDWRRRDKNGNLRISREDAIALALSDGDSARVVTQSGAATVTIEVSDMMQAGNIALPNGFGLDCPTEDGTLKSAGVSPNELTSAGHKDDFAGTPWHKHVPARLEAIR
ncbi:molybdopterin-dependent oxidoreductase [Antrihabitans stalagmiti]|nr:molybdopterin-dependent oxidoreductase [Antrihabitans stalagmiti]